MATNLVPLQAAIKLIADAAGDAIKASGDSSTALKAAEFENLIPDVLALLPQIGQISLAGLAPADYATLLTNLATDLALPASHTAAIINASIKVIEDLVTVVYPDVKVLIAAIQAAPTPAPAATPA
jgi:hypothetical protein